MLKIVNGYLTLKESEEEVILALAKRYGISFSDFIGILESGIAKHMKEKKQKTW